MFMDRLEETRFVVALAADDIHVPEGQSASKNWRFALDHPTILLHVIGCVDRRGPRSVGPRAIPGEPQQPRLAISPTKPIRVRIYRPYPCHRCSAAPSTSKAIESAHSAASILIATNRSRRLSSPSGCRECRAPDGLLLNVLGRSSLCHRAVLVPRPQVPCHYHRQPSRTSHLSRSDSDICIYQNCWRSRIIRLSHQIAACTRRRNPVTRTGIVQGVDHEPDHRCRLLHGRRHHRRP